MEDYVIRRNKVKIFWLWLILSGIAVVFLWLTLGTLVGGYWGQFSQLFGCLILAFVAITTTYASVVSCGQLVFGQSEFLKLTQEGFYYTGYFMGRKVYFSSWQEVDRVFYTEIAHRYRGSRSYSRFISVDFKDPELWEKQFSINRSNSKLVRILAKYSKRKYKNGDLDIPLAIFTDHSEKRIHEVIDLMRTYHQQALIKEKNP